MGFKNKKAGKSKTLARISYSINPFWKVVRIADKAD
jgi:hypothetical protein